MALAKRSVQGSYPLPSWMEVLRQVSVLISGRGSRKAVFETLEGLQKGSAPWLEIIVVSEGLEDRAQNLIAEQFPKVKVIPCDKVLTAAPENQGLHQAEGRWVLSLQPGSVPDIGSWEGLCRILYTEPEVDIISLSILRQHRDSLRQQNRASLVEAGSFKRAGFLVKRASIEAFGGFDDELREGGSELHWCARVVVNGGEALHCPEASIIQASGAEMRSPKDWASQVCCNQLLFILRFAPAPSWRRLVHRRIRDVLMYTLLHRTLIYAKAIRQARALWLQHPEKVNRMSETQFRRLSVELQAPFGYLG